MRDESVVISVISDEGNGSERETSVVEDIKREIYVVV